MRDDHSVSGDLVGGQAGSWLVIGWFTEDATYRPLVEAFAANRTEHGAPFHLFSRPPLGGWDTSPKPAVVLEAMDRYPGKTLTLMDIDCVVHGDLSPLARIDADVGITAIARNVRKGRRWSHSLLIELSSRVVVFRPTAGARAFAQAWADEIERSIVRHDENSMAWAYLSSPGVRFGYIPQEYSGREAGTVPGSIVEHNSAHDEERKAQRRRIKRALRAFERRFLRSGARASPGSRARCRSC